MVGCPGFDVVEFDDLKSFHTKSVDWSCEQAGVELGDGERSEIAFALDIESVRSKVGLGDLMTVAFMGL